MSVVLRHCLVLCNVVVANSVSEGFGTDVPQQKYTQFKHVFLTSKLFLRIWRPTHMEPQTASNNLATT